MTTMKTNQARLSAATGPPLHELLELLESMTDWSVGLVRVPGNPPRFPRQCLTQCLGGQPHAVDSAGCAWLRATIRDRTQPPLPTGGRCDQGFQIRVSPSKNGGQHLGLFALRDEAAGDRTDSHLTTPTAAHVAACIDEVLQRTSKLTEEISAGEEENTRLAEEVLQSYEQLNLLFEMTRATVTRTSVEDVYDIAMDRLSASLRAEFACFLDTQGHYVRTVSRFDSGPLKPAVCRQLHHPDTSCEIRRAILGAETRTLNPPAGGGHQPHEPTLSMLLVPLRSGEEVLGGVLFVRPTEDPFRTGDRSMAETVMGQVAHMAHRVRLFHDLQQMSIDVVRALVQAIDAKDNYTSGHSERVARWSMILGAELNLTPDSLQTLAWAGRLHDVGKIGIRDDVLGKPGRLTDDEFDHIRQHPVISYEVLKPIHRLAPVLDGVRHHHEAWDGSGYPDGLAGERIPLNARIIQMADVFDALTSARSYREAYTMEDALEIMRLDAGAKLDPHMVEIFCRVVERTDSQGSDLLTHVPRRRGTDKQPEASTRSPESDS